MARFRLLSALLLFDSSSFSRAVEHIRRSAELAYSADQSSALRVFHITDAHLALQDEHPGHTTRMFNAFVERRDKFQGMPMSPKDQFTRLLKMACDQNVDLIALGGDILNFPSNRTVSWVLDQLAESGCSIPYMYMAGNHDWHEEFLDADKHYDSQRRSQLQQTLQPLFAHSVAPQNPLYGRKTIKGVDVVYVDNSNYQVDQEQLSFVQRLLADGANSTPVLLMLHVPLKMPGVPDLPPEELCGHPDWDAEHDRMASIEGRSRWPAEGNLQSTKEFIRLVQVNAAPSGRLAAVLSGHVHKEFSHRIDTPECVVGQADCGAASSMFQVEQYAGAIGDVPRLQAVEGCMQFCTLDAAEGGYRLLVLGLGDAFAAPGSVHA